MTNPLDRLRHHVTGAIERGEAEAITEKRDIWHDDDGVWAQVTGTPEIGGELLGPFDTEEEAERAYDNWHLRRRSMGR